MPQRKATVERLVAFSDSVFAVLITIMVLELKPRDHPTFAALLPLWPTALSYAGSYQFIAIVWMNHHHLLRFVDESTPRLMWINFAHLFMVSRVPFATAWVANSRLAAVPVFVYAAVFVLVEPTYFQFERHALANAVVEEISHRSRRLAKIRSVVAFGLFSRCDARIAQAPVLELWVSVLRSTSLSAAGASGTPNRGHRYSCTKEREIGSTGDRFIRMNSRARDGMQSELIAAVLAGDTQLYHELIRPYERSVYLLTLCYVRNAKDAEDVTQETFIRAFRCLSAFRRDSEFSTWLIGIARDEARRRQTTIGIASLDGRQREAMALSPALLRHWRKLPSDVVEREEIRKLLQQAFEMLPAIYQQVFILRDVEELTVVDTAQILDISTALVRVRLHQARTMLQRLLGPQLKTINGASEPDRGSVDTNLTTL